MFDHEGRLVVWNARYAEIYQLPSNLLKVGTPREEIADHIIGRGISKGRIKEFLLHKRKL